MQLFSYGPPTPRLRARHVHVVDGREPATPHVELHEAALAGRHQGQPSSVLFVLFSCGRVGRRRCGEGVVATWYAKTFSTSSSESATGTSSTMARRNARKASGSMLNASWHKLVKDTPVETLTSTDSEVGYFVIVGAGVGVGVGAGEGTAVGVDCRHRARDA